jgi:hypothetical protein
MISLFQATSIILRSEVLDVDSTVFSGCHSFRVAFNVSVWGKVSFNMVVFAEY